MAFRGLSKKSKQMKYSVDKKELKHHFDILKYVKVVLLTYLMGQFAALLTQSVLI